MIELDVEWMGGVNEVNRTVGQKGEIRQEIARLRWKDCIQRGMGRVEENRRVRINDTGN